MTKRRSVLLGRVHNTFEANNEQASKDAAQKHGGELVVAGGQRAELLQAAKEPFDFVALLVFLLVVLRWVAPVGARWDHGFLAGGFEQRANGIAVIGTVAPQRLDGLTREDFREHFFAHGRIAGLPAAQDHPKHLVLAHRHCMNLRAQATTRAAQGLLALFFRAPAAC